MHTVRSTTGRPSARVLLLAAVALIFVGCSTRRLLYQLGPTLVLHEVDEALELEPQQKEMARVRLRALFAWHRREELPVYGQRLDELRRRIADGVSREDLTWVRSTVEELIGRFGRHVAPEMGTFLATLQPSQLDHFEQTVAKRSQKHKDLLDLPAEEYVDKRSREAEKTMSRWAGPLEPAQTELIRAFVRRTRDAALVRRAVEERRYKDFMALLRRHQSAETIRDAILARLTPGEPDLTPAERVTTTRVEAEFEELTMALDRAATPAQRHRLDGELASIHEDIVGLLQP